MIVGELTIIPVGQGSSMEDVLEEVEKAIKNMGIDHEVGALGTTLQAERMEDILEATRKAHDVVKEMVPRVIVELRIDHRMDKEETRRSLADLKA